MNTYATVARTLAPEDIMPGRYVAILHEIEEYRYPNCNDGSLTTARVCDTPRYTDFPVKVVSVCLPFVFVETANGDTDMLDVRRLTLAAVPARFAAPIHDRERRLKSRNG